MKINWKVRLRNPVFWLSAVPAFITTVYSLLGLFGIVPMITEDTIINAITTIVSGLTTLGVLIDPTTKGTSDSEQALTYSKPK